MDLKTRFPITYSLCKKYRTRPEIVTQKDITYDKSAIPILTQHEINAFIKLQIKYPEIIDMCFDDLINVLEKKEQLEQQMITRNKKNLIESQPNPMSSIYERLIKLNVHKNDLGFIDKWVLFIKSQNEFSCFF